MAGYTVANDITMRDYQYKTHQWLQGKAWDDCTPVGPYLVTPDEVDLSVAGIRTVLNGAVVQESTVSQLFFDIPTLISTISTFTTLNPGDLILTGTPGGVGFRRKPQLFLTDGDTVAVEIDGVGRIQNRIVAERSPAEDWRRGGLFGGALDQLESRTDGLGILLRRDDRQNRQG